jgi:thioredoxin 1
MIQLSENNIQEIYNANYSLIQFTAEWCGTCRLIAPVIDEASAEYEGKAIIGKLNVDSHAEIARQFGIMSIPTLLFLKDGKVQDKHVGVISKTDLKKKLDILINS